MTAASVTPEYVHHVPGRLRVRIREIRRDEVAGSRLAALISSSPGVRSVEVNPLTGSITIYYDCSQTGHSALLSALNANTTHVLIRPAKPLRRSSSARTCEMCGRPVDPSMLSGGIGQWLLGKTVQFALEKSLVLAIGALL